MRSNFKIPFCNKYLINTVLKQHKNSLNRFFLMDRSLLLLPVFKDYKFKLYNGKKFELLVLMDEMIGHRFGSFFFTRRSDLGISIHGSSKAKKLKKDMASVSKKATIKKKQ